MPNAGSLSSRSKKPHPRHTRRVIPSPWGKIGVVEFWLVRHAQSRWNALGKWQGQADPDLSARGRKQAEEAASRQASKATHQPLKTSPFAAVASSDLARAKSTAEIIASATGCGPVVVDAGLREREIGEWEGLTAEEIEARDPGALDSGWRPPGWELDEPLLERAVAAFHRIRNAVSSTHSPKSPPDPRPILVVIHAGILYALEMYFDHEFRKTSNLTGRVLTYTADDNTRLSGGLNGGLDGYVLGERITL